MTNSQVIEAFLKRRHGLSGNTVLKSTGNNLFSYNLEIARWHPKGVMTVLNTASGEYKSQTTSKHVGYIRSALARRPDITWNLKTP